MKIKSNCIIASALFCLCLIVSCQKKSNHQDLSTIGDNSPAIWASKASVIYGLPPKIIERLVAVYKEHGLSVQQRRQKTEQLLKEYSSIKKSAQTKAKLNASDLQKLKIAKQPKVANIFNWDLFLSTQGKNSPAIYAMGGNVEVWYGIPEGAFKGIWKLLEENQVSIESFSYYLDEQVKLYKELETRLSQRNKNDKRSIEIGKLLREGKLLEAEQLMEKDFSLVENELANKAFELGKIKELNLKFEEAINWYQKATLLNDSSYIFLESYVDILAINGKYDQIISEQEKILSQVDTTIARQALAERYHALGLAYEAKAQYDLAIEFYKKAIVIDRENPDEVHSNLSDRFHNLGTTYDSKGEYALSMEYYCKTLHLDTLKYGHFHTNTAICYNNIGENYRVMGKYDKAIEHYEIALHIDTIAYGPKHPEISVRYNNLGLVYADLEEFEKAKKYFKKTITMDSIFFGINYHQVATSINNLGDVYESQDSLSKALYCFKKAIQIDSLTGGIEHPNFSTKYNNLGLLYYRLKKYKLAIYYLNHSLKIGEAVFGKDHSFLATGYGNLATIHDNQKQDKIALQYYQKALELDIKAFGLKHSFVATDYDNLGVFFKTRKNYKSAIEHLLKALKIYQLKPEYHKDDLVTIHLNLGKSYVEDQQFADALSYINQGIELAKGMDENNTTLASLYSLKEMSLKKLNRHDEAKALIESVKEQL